MICCVDLKTKTLHLEKKMLKEINKCLICHDCVIFINNQVFIKFSVRLFV